MPTHVIVCETVCERVRERVIGRKKRGRETEGDKL